MLFNQDGTAHVVGQLLLNNGHNEQLKVTFFTTTNKMLLMHFTIVFN